MTTRTKIGLAGTIAWGGVIVYFLISKRPHVGDLPLNEWGDFFAGFIAPVAFLWLILGYFQQGEELRQNTEALKLQQQELHHQVEETRALVREAERQTTVSADLLALEREQLADTRREEKARRQPTFSFVRGSVSGSTSDMTFRNDGGPATGLAIVAAPTGASIHIDPRDHMPSNSEGRIITGNVTTYPLVISVAYRDARGDAGECRLELHQPGSFRPVPPADIRV